MKTIKNILYLFLFLSNIIYSQNNKLDNLRKQYGGKNYKTYINNKKLCEKRNQLPPTSPLEEDKRSNKFVKLFSIPLKERLKLYPFNLYDSIYIATPNFIEDIEEPRNYLEPKYHANIRLITKKEIYKISTILFNYSLLSYNSTTKVHNTTCCIEGEYPRVILLFKKNGQYKNFLAIPTEIYTRWNFTDNEMQVFDLSSEKEKLILKMFNIN